MIMIFKDRARAWSAPLAVWLGVLALTAAPACRAQDTLTLDDALARAVAADPAAEAFDARIAAAQAGLRQAGVRPNPVIGVEIEDIAGTGPYALLDRSQTTLFYEQSLERGGKREARLGVARADLDAVRIRRDVRALDLMKAVQTAWVEAAAAEAALAIAQDRLALANRTKAEVKRRVQAARDPLFAFARAHTQTAEAEIAVEQARLAADRAKAGLASYWRGPPGFTVEAAALAKTDVPAAASPASVADTRLAEAEREIAAAKVRVEQARAVQDPSWRAGVRHFRDGQAVALIVGGSIPLARYDANAGAIDQAVAQRRAADADGALARIEREREIARLTASLAARAAEARRIGADVLPRAVDTVDLVRDGFNRGGFSLLDVADAQRALIDAKERRLEALKAFHLDQAALDRLTGRHAGLIPAFGDPPMTVRTLAWLMAAALAVAACDGKPKTAESHADADHEAAADAVPKGPHGGRLLTDGDFALEVVIVEDETAPRMHLFAYAKDKPVDPRTVAATVALTRLGGRVDRLVFAAEGDHLRGDGAVSEPHSFDVVVEAIRGGRRHRWTYASYEGRTTLTPEAARAGGVQTAVAGPAQMGETLDLAGRIEVTPEGRSEVRAWYPGRVMAVAGRIGQSVRRGQVLARVESSQSLQTYAIPAPISGLIVEKTANVGDVAYDRPLFVIADPTRLHAEFFVYPRDAERVRAGQGVAVRSLSGDARTVGRVETILPTADVASQTLLAHVHIDAGPAWRPGMGVEGAVQVATYTAPLAVRTEALQRFRDFTVVFAQVGDVYEVRMLTLGRRTPEWTEVLGGLRPGERYVTKGAFLIRADIEKSGASHDH